MDLRKASLRTWVKKSSQDPINKKESAMRKARQEHFRQKPTNKRTLSLDRAWHILGGSLGREK